MIFVVTTLLRSLPHGLIALRSLAGTLRFARILGESIGQSTAGVTPQSDVPYFQLALCGPMFWDESFGCCEDAGPGR